MKLTSPAFAEAEIIPAKYTCTGQDINPPLDIENIPEATKSLTLIMEDPDAPSGNFVHWILFNIKPCNRIAEASAPGEQGENDFGQLCYGGPCPPSGTHRYFFRLFALNTYLRKQGKMDKIAVVDAMNGHIIEKAQLMGKYCKQ
jgi:hypothetical protein